MSELYKRTHNITNIIYMANKDWGQKRLCEDSGKKFYDFNKKPIISPFTGKELIFEDLNLKPLPVITPKPEVKKTDELQNIDDTSEDSSDDDIISLDDQKEIEESNEEKKPD